jgi:hypothetical protein
MENYTAEEILEIVHGLGLPGEIVTDEDDLPAIDIEFEEFKWQILLGGDSPFFSHITLFAFKSVPQSSHSAIHAWNRDHATSTSFLLIDSETSEYTITEDNEFVNVLKCFVSFTGPISDKSINFLIYCFQDDVCEFYGIQTEDEDAENHAPMETPDGDPIPLIEQIQLELALNAPQSARSIAKSLNTSKYEVNSTLYRHIEMFENEGTSPPLWTNKSSDFDLDL